MRKEEQPMDEWAGLVSDRDVEIYELAGFGRPGGLGSRPALVIIDVQYRTVGIPRTDIKTAIRESYPTACGEVGWAVVDRLVPLVRSARSAGLPLVYPYVAPKKPGTLGRLGGKVPSISQVDDKGYEFVAEIAPQDEDVLVAKKHPSGFSGTPMTSELIERSIDTLLVAGCTTSGCVRATVTDAFALNFRVAVIRDAVYDRGDTSHRVNLFDMASKYADLITVAEAIDYVTTVRSSVDR